jgi:hypothetical protein
MTAQCKPFGDGVIVNDIYRIRDGLGEFTGIRGPGFHENQIAECEAAIAFQREVHIGQIARGQHVFGAMNDPQKKRRVVDMDEPDIVAILCEFGPAEQSSNNKSSHEYGVPEAGEPRK